MEKSKVVLIRCKSYDDDLFSKLKAAVDALGGIGAFVGKDERILIKPNVLRGLAPEKAVSTHPAVFDAVLRLLREEGFEKLSYGDSPADTPNGIRGAMEASALAGIAERYGVPLADFEHSADVKYPEGKTAKRFVLVKAAVDSDAVISVCKMKTHALENITGAVKNQYGLVCGAHKRTGHALYPNSTRFARMLCDLNRFIKPRLFIMDGIVAMDGNGPGSGDPIRMGTILVSADPVALDTVFAKLVFLKPENVPTCIMGSRAGLGTMDERLITVLTENGELTPDEAAEKFGRRDFNVNRKAPMFWPIALLFPHARGKKEKPVVDNGLCIGCGMCQQVCPVEGKAVFSGNGSQAVYDYSKCIRCYCCQEICPVKAISKG